MSKANHSDNNVRNDEGEHLPDAIEEQSPWSATVTFLKSLSSYLTSKNFLHLCLDSPQCSTSFGSRSAEGAT